MATLEEYKAVHGGKEPPQGKGTATEFGDGGCNVIFKDKGGVIGRWTSRSEASDALVNLQQIGTKWEYRIEESHHWVHGLAGKPKCSLCGAERQLFTANANGMEWPA